MHSTESYYIRVETQLDVQNEVCTFSIPTFSDKTFPLVINTLYEDQIIDINSGYWLLLTNDKMPTFWIDRDAVGGGCDKATWAQYTYIILDNDLKPKQPKNLVEYAKYLLEILKYRTSSCHID